MHITNQEKLIMKRVIIRTAILVMLLGLALYFNFRLEENQESYWQTESLTFKLPLPENVWEQYGIDEPLSTNQISAVYVAGFFNNWNPLNHSYQLKQVRPDQWEIPVMLYSGENQYKFVVYIKGREAPVWTQDITRPGLADDHFGGYNSVIYKKDTRVVYQAGFYVILILLFFYLLYITLDLITYIVHHYRLGLQVKIVLMVLFVSILALSINTFVNMRQARITASAGLTDSINMIHLYLKGMGVDFDHLTDPAQKEKLEGVVKQFFYSAHARVQKNNPSNSETFISSLMIFDTDTRLVSLFKRKEGENLAYDVMKQFSYTNINQYYEEFIFGELRKKVMANKADQFQIQYGAMRPELFKLMSGRDRLAARFLGYENILIPIIIDQHLKGYYGATIHSQIYGRSIFYMIGFNILSGFLVALFMLVYFLFFHKDPSEAYLYDRFFSRYNISKREQDVVQLLCEGYSNHDISERLFISEGTVKAHIYHVFQKAEVAHRLELISLIKSLK